MTDPRVLVRLDLLLGGLSVIALLLAAQLVLDSGGAGLIAVIGVGVLAALGGYWYRRALDAAAA